MEENQKMHSFGTRITIAIVAVVAFSAIIVGAVGNRNMQKLENNDVVIYESAMLDGYNNEVKSVVQSAISLCRGYDEAVSRGELTMEEAQYACKEAIRSMRYKDDESGYLWIDDTDYNLVMHPILAEQEGTNRYELTDVDGIKIIQEIMKKAGDGGGYSEFQFTKSDGVTVAPKVAYSEMYEPWGWVITTGNYTDDMNEIINVQKENMDSNRTHTILMSSAATLIIIFLAVVLTPLVMRRLRNLLLKLGSNTLMIADGNLAVDLKTEDITRKDEIGNIARGIVELLNKFRQIVQNMMSTSNGLNENIEAFKGCFAEIADSIDAVNTAVEEIAQGSTSLANDTTDASAKIAEIGAAIDENTKRVSTLRESADVMREIAGIAHADVKELSNISNNTADSLNKIKDQIIATGDSVEKMKNAVGLIEQIAGQTNLLSLNASIEAARAGESGRGFAVVAEQIRQLADECANSTSEISNIIEELNQNSENNVKGIVKVNTDMESQIEKLNRTVDNFTQLEKEIQVVADDSDAISEQVHVIGNLKDSVNDTIAGLSSISEQNAANTEETSATMNNLLQIIEECDQKTDELARYSSALLEQTNQFKL